MTTIQMNPSTNTETEAINKALANIKTFLTESWFIKTYT
jgi:hypothetical protein